MFRIELELPRGSTVEVVVHTSEPAGTGAPTLRIDLTATNVFNRRQYAAPNLNVTPTNAAAGQISAIGGTAGFIQQAGMRTMQLGARVEF